MITYEKEALDFIVKAADGGMRDALTLLDKCLAYSQNLTVENVIKALGIMNYDYMFDLLHAQIECNVDIVIKHINEVYNEGKDLKLYIKQYQSFVLDVCKYQVQPVFTYIKIPNVYKDKLNSLKKDVRPILDTLVRLNSDLKWDTQPKVTIESQFMLDMYERKNAQ